jgi:hypothetical protein
MITQKADFAVEDSFPRIFPEGVEEGAFPPGALPKKWPKFAVSPVPNCERLGARTFSGAIHFLGAWGTRLSAALRTRRT